MANTLSYSVSCEIPKGSFGFRLDSEVTAIIAETAEGISQRYAIEMEALGCDKDHIHLSVGERGNWGTVEKYIQKQGKPKTHLSQLKLFD